MARPVDPLETLCGLKEDELREYVRRRLRGEPSVPPVNWSIGQAPQTFLVDASHAIADGAFRERLGRVVAQLVEGWRPGAETAEYLSRLANLAGDIGASNAVPALRSLCASPAVPDAEVEGRDLREALLRAVLAFPGQEGDSAFWEKYFDDPRRADVAFLAAYRRDPVDAIRYVARYLSVALDTMPQGALRLRMANYVLDYLKTDELYRLAPAILALDKTKRDRALDILKSLRMPAAAWERLREALKVPE